MDSQEERPVRLGSIHEYIRYLTTSTVLVSVSGVCVIAGGIGALTTLFCLGKIFFSGGDFYEIVSLLMAGFVLGTVSSAFLLFGWSAATEVQHVEPIEPLTLAKADRLPASETLVRASEPPTEGEEHFLLRAAQPTEAIKPEELLRPAGSSME